MNTINGYTREEAMQKAFKIAFEGESNRLSCSQNSYNAVAEVFGIKNELIFKCVNPLEGGGAIMATNSCGAFSGALIVIGYFFGRTYDQFEKKEIDMRASDIGQKLYERFIDKFATAICRDILKKLLGFETDFRDEEQFKRYEDAGGHSTVCPTIIGLTASWTVDILWDEIPKDKDLSQIPDLKDADSLLLRQK